ncbi:MAG: ComF family protein [Calditrichaeota bacterium]|nr:MAG: ComF family protein [Calditrichota bacterium]
MEQTNESLILSVLDFVFPPLCIGCGEYTDESDMICKSCLATINKLNDIYCLKCHTVLEGRQRCDFCVDDALLLYSYGEYHSALKEMIIQFKFKGITKPAQLFSQMIAENFYQQITDLNADYLIPIPLATSREKKRGFNQAEIIAEHLSNHLQIPVNNDILYRVKNNKPQARLSMDKRAKNVRAVFDIDEDLTEKYNLILVDDVVTTGSTILEAVSVLQSGGYKIPGVITLAHAFNL